MKKLLFVLALILFVSCSDNPTDNKNKAATKVDLAQVQSYPGFIDFKTSYESYEPNSLYIDSLRSTFNSSEDKVYIYLKPECGCNASLKTFPQMMKSLHEAGISDDNIIMYVMEDESYTYPESSFIIVNDLPQFFTMKGQSVSSFNPDTNLVEQVLYNSFK